VGIYLVFQPTLERKAHFVLYLLIFALPKQQALKRAYELEAMKAPSCAKCIDSYAAQISCLPVEKT